MDSTQRLEANAKLISRQVDWKRTKIQATDGARESDPWRELGLTPSSGYGKGMLGRSYGRDALLDSIEEVAADQLDSTARGYLVGLRFYLGNLPRGAEPKERVVRPLLEGFMANRDRQ